MEYTNNTNIETTTDEATYCPEDNKIRLYFSEWLSESEWARVKEAGFKHTPKQSCSAVATWRLHREDLAIELFGEVGDEDTSPQDRAADRAERFAMYRDKRRSDATGHADTYDSQPHAHGFQDARKAERAAKRHDRQGSHAVNNWSKAEYWQDRTEGVIDHALYVTAPSVRRRRLEGLEKDKRKADSYVVQYAEHYPDEPERGENARRVAAHYANRIKYEETMLGIKEDRAGTLNITIGGTWKDLVIVHVKKSRKSGRVEVVTLADSSTVYIENSEPQHYAEPTPEGMEAVKVYKKAKRAADKIANADKPKSPKLLNPTDKAANKLQAHLNAIAVTRENEYCKSQPQDVLKMTQKEYSYHSKGSYAHCKSMFLYSDGVIANHWRRADKMETAPHIICKVRKCYPKGAFTGNAYRVIIITDKKQHDLPSWTPIKEEATA